MSEALLQDALKLRRAGRLAEAAEIYRQVLTSSPSSFDALHALGIVRYQCGDLKEAERLISQAVAVNPSAADAHYNRGSLLLRLGRMEDAVASFENAIALKPDYVEALTNRGNALVQLQHYDEALSDFERATKLRPDLLQVWANRGAALFRLGRYPEAIASYDRVLAQQPTQAEARIGRGDALLALQRLDEALSEFDRVIQAQPQNTGAWTRRGAALSQLGRAEDAIAAFSRALEMKPEDAETLDRRGNMYLMLRRFEEAARDFSRTLALDPDFPWTHGNLAYCRLHCCDWAILEASSAAILRAARDGRLACAPLQYLSVAGFDGNTSEVQAGALSQARAFVQHQYPPSLQPLWRGERYAHDRIRLAYLSADFNDHAVARLIAGVFECHDRSRFETIGVSLRPDDRSPMRRRLEAAFDTFRDVRGLGDAEVAAWLRASEVDVAIDLNGFTSGCRPGILARRPAPVQAQFLGFPGTMGAPYIDYLIADEGVVPPDQRRHYQEKIVCLPRPYLPADARRATPGATPSRAKAGLPETGFVFCCFSGLFKITPTMFGVWMRLLLRVEDSVLWLPSGNSAALSALQGEAQRRGVDPRRLIFASFTATAEEHLSRLQLADLFLDTLPYNAHATACDALWAGVPLLTLEGASFAGRVAASALKGVGLDELITRTVEDYEALALALARDPARLRGLREKLRQARVASPLFDTQGFTRDLEAAIAMMCERQRRGEPPESFAVGQAGRGPA